jgi:hypothetical protein
VSEFIWTAPHPNIFTKYSKLLRLIKMGLLPGISDENFVEHPFDQQSNDQPVVIQFYRAGVFPDIHIEDGTTATFAVSSCISVSCCDIAVLVGRSE